MTSGSAGGSFVGTVSTGQPDQLLMQLEPIVATRDVLTDCPCVGGCPSCVQSPKCGNGNEPLDKAAAARLITATLDSAQTSPAPTDSDKEESGTGEPSDGDSSRLTPRAQSAAR